MSVFTQDGKQVLPGDFAAVRTTAQVSALIEFGQWCALRVRLIGRPVPPGDEDFEHAIFYAGNDMILEAEPGGAKFVKMHYKASDCLWSTGKKSLALSIPQMADAYAVAKKYEGTKYSFLDYEAIALHSLHIPAPGLRDFIADSGHMICSQAVDKCRQDLGSKLFDDKRWNGYVDPLDLALLIENAK